MLVITGIIDDFGDLLINQPAQIAAGIMIFWGGNTIEQVGFIRLGTVRWAFLPFHLPRCVPSG